MQLDTGWQILSTESCKGELIMNLIEITELEFDVGILLREETDHIFTLDER